MNVAGLPVVVLKSMLIACLGLACSSLALAQTAAGTTPRKIEKKKDAAQEQRERAIARCRGNRGVDCDSAEGLREWIEQERPITDEERQRAVARRSAREADERRAPRPGGASQPPR